MASVFQLLDGRYIADFDRNKTGTRLSFAARDKAMSWAENQLLQVSQQSNYQGKTIDYNHSEDNISRYQLEIKRMQEGTEREYYHDTIEYGDD